MCPQKLGLIQNNLVFLTFLVCDRFVFVLSSSSQVVVISETGPCNQGLFAMQLDYIVITMKWYGSLNSHNHPLDSSRLFHVFLPDFSVHMSRDVGKIWPWSLQPFPGDDIKDVRPCTWSDVGHQRSTCHLEFRLARNLHKLKNSIHTLWNQLQQQSFKGWPSSSVRECFPKSPGSDVNHFASHTNKGVISKAAKHSPHFISFSFSRAWSSVSDAKTQSAKTSSV